MSLIQFYADSGNMFVLSGEGSSHTPAVAFTEPISNKPLDSTNEWVNWTRNKGQANQFGNEIAEKIRLCGVLNTAIKASARIALGKGLKPVKLTGIDAKTGEETYEYIDDKEIEDFLNNNHHFKYSLRNIRNSIGWGWTHGRFVLNPDGNKIAAFKIDDIVKCRLGKKNKKGVIEKTYYAADWAQNLINSKENVKPLTLLQEDNEVAHLQDLIKTKTTQREFSFIQRGELDGMEYYPYPTWYPAWDWVDMDIKIPAMKVAMFNNQITVKLLITIHEQYFKEIHGDKWMAYSYEEAQAIREAKAQEINKHLTGNENAYKSIVTNSYVDQHGNQIEYIKIQVIDDKIKDGKLLPDSSAAIKQVLFACMMNPALFGANIFGSDFGGGAGSGSDIREAYLVQIMLMETERQLNSRVFDIISKVNGWQDRYEGKLRFKYPNLILTTLDTGGSTAPSNT